MREGVNVAEIRIKADIAGVVAQVLVQVGTDLQEDEPLMLMDSMKMEIPVQAPRAGRVLQICAAEGEQVAEGDLLAVMQV